MLSFEKVLKPMCLFVKKFAETKYYNDKINRFQDGGQYGG